MSNPEVQLGGGNDCVLLQESLIDLCEEFGVRIDPDHLLGLFTDDTGKLVPYGVALDAVMQFCYSVGGCFNDDAPE